MTESAPIPPKPQTLLAEEDFLRGLLRGLFKDASGIDDILQKTWLQALLHPPRKAGQTRAFLAQIARNFAREEIRKEQRRSRHEREAAEPEQAMPSPEDLLQREADRRRVIEALLALPEPYRGSLILRFYEQLSPTQIARRLQVPAATVRSRIRRGLIMLREKLDSSYGDRSRWVMALIPLAPKSSLGLPTLGSGAAIKALTGIASIMSAKSKLSLAMATVVVCVLTVVLSMPERLAPNALDSTAGQELALGGVELASESEERETATEALADSADREGMQGPAAWQFAGSVRRMQGGPLPRAKIRIESFRGYGVEGEPLSETVIEADAQGDFRWSTPRLEEATAYRLQPADPNFYAAPHLIRCHPADPELPRIALRFTELAVELRGKILSTKGEGIEGARISWYDRIAAESDGEGRYRLMIPVRTLPLNISTREHADMEITLTVPAGVSSLEKDFVLQDGYRLEGRVQDEDGGAIPGAQVSWLDSSYHRIESDEHGAFAMAHLDPRAESFLIAARADGYLEEVVEVPRGEQDLRIVLRRGAGISGVVVDRAGTPIEGAEIFVRHVALANNAADAMSGADGRFAVRGLDDQEYLLCARRRGYALAIQEIEIAAADLEDLRLVLGESLSLKGRVTDQRGQGLADAFVYLNGPENPGLLGMDLRVDRIWADAEGRFVFEDLPNIPLDVGALRDGYRRSRRNQVFPGAGELLIELGQIAGIAGRVVDGITGKALDSFRIRFLPPTLQAGEEMPKSFSASWVEGQTFHGDDGSWSTLGDEEFAAGRVIAIEASAEGYATAVLDRLVCEYDPDPDAHVLRLYPGTQVEGRVIDAGTGQSIAGAVLLLERENALDWGLMMAGRKRTGDSILSDGEGRFLVPEVPEGRFRLVARHVDYAPTRTEGYQAGRGPAAMEVNIAMSLGSSLHGSLSKGLLSETVVEIELQAIDVPSADPGQVWEAEIDSSGKFEFDQLGPGLYRVTPLLRGNMSYRPFSQSVRLGDSSRLEITLDMPAEGATLSGVLHFDTKRLGTAVARLRPVGEDKGTRPLFEVPVVDGSFVFPALLPGDYVLDARFGRQPGGMRIRGSRKISIEAGELQEVDLSVELEEIR